MKTIRILILALIAGMSAFTSCAYAQSLRCNGDLASVGDSKASVLQKCGEPALLDSFCKEPDSVLRPALNPTSSTVTVNVQACEQVDEWTYKPGPGQFLTTLQFRRGVVTAIKYGDRIK